MVSAEQRTKEIDAHTAPGSSAAEIVILFSSKLLIIVDIANVIAWPIGLPP